MSFAAILKIVTGKLGIMIMAGLLAFGYYTWSKSQINTLKENIKVMEVDAFKLKSSNAIQKKTIESLAKDVKVIKQVNKNIAKQTQVYASNVAELKTKLDVNKQNQKRDIEAMAGKHKVWVSDLINRGSHFRARCLEIATGSPIFPEEVLVNKKDRNNLCPELFDYAK